MIVSHNLEALNAERQLNIKNNEKAAAVKRLSSGYRINVAADDAAGLAISEKMRSMIRGLTRASINAQEGISLVQVGDGALNEIHAMLHRLKELAVESSNGTWINRDRDMLQDELEQICEEIDSIAETTNFNTIYLFQNEGYECERLGYPSEKIDKTESSNAAWGAAGSTQTADNAVNADDEQTAGSSRTLDDLLANTDRNELNVVYVERIDARVDTEQSQTGTANNLSNEITIGGKPLSRILKTEIIPNTINNILQNYPAFSYLKGSSIGIGLEYFGGASSGGTTTLAYVKGKVGSGGSADGSGNIVSREDMITYTLGVNTDVLQGITDRTGLEELEATIAHEMIHAFMDEALTMGMFGVKENSTNGQLTTKVSQFPDWFIEGMAQTASGPGNWLKSSSLHITENSTDDEIKAAIQSNKLGSGSTASQYGTGYLACMYLGSVIAGGGSPAAATDAATISAGLTKLFNQLLSGDSLNDSINSLTKGKFTSSTDFVAKFNNGSSEIAGFVRDLLQATGNGRGGIVSGDLTATDLTADTDLGDSVKLFQLDPSHTEVKNIYPDGYNVYSGGTTDVAGTAPTDFNPAPPGKDYGDFVVTGALDSDIDYDASTNTLTVKGSSDVTISLKNGLSSSNGKLILQGDGSVTLDNMKLSAADALTIQKDTKIVYTGVNQFGGIELNPNQCVIFEGTGRMEADSFSADGTNTVIFSGGAVVIGSDGNGTLAADVIIDKDNSASVAAAISPNPTDYGMPDGKELYATPNLPWDKLTSLKGEIVSVSIDGKSSKMQIENGGVGKFWLPKDDDPSVQTKHKIVVTDSFGVSRTLIAELNDVTGTFEWAELARPFQITKAGGAAAVEGTDYHYEGDGKLVIDVAGDYVISGGKSTGMDGEELLGCIELSDGIGAVGVTLDGVECTPTKDCAFDLGEGNSVTIELADGKQNTFQSSDNYAGIQFGDNTQLVIKESVNGTGVLEATGGRNSAGIGSSNNSPASGSSIEIKGGTITAKGGYYGAGIGAGANAGFGNITITGGTVNAAGGTGAAGIGGSDGSKATVGDIEITGGKIEAVSKEHGAGIGGGWSSSNGAITISGGEITAFGVMHGTGIGAGCSGATGKITITGNAHIIKAQGGDDGAGIGASWNGRSTADIEISGNAVIDEARGGDRGAGIGSGSSNSRIGSIVIDTDGSVNAYGGENGVGIGSGYGGSGTSSCGDITIKKGTVLAEGGTDSTGIGAGRDSVSGSIALGDAANPDSKVVVTAIGGMTNGGGNILSYGNASHADGSEGTVTITGNGTTVRPGQKGEGLYSTSGVTDDAGNKIYSYPVYLFQDADGPLEAGVDLEDLNLLPLDVISGVDRSKISNIRISSDKGAAWDTNISHQPLEEDYVFLWLLNEDQKLTITYDYIDAAGKNQKGTVELDLIFYEDAGVFRVGKQEKPPAAEKPEYVTKPNPPVTPDPPEEDPELPYGPGGIILQIGANEGQILEIPRFYLSIEALKMGNLDISTQKNAWDSLPILRDALARVSKIRSIYGAYQNRLEHTVANLDQSAENLTAAESRIRDADMAEEVMFFAKSSILTEAAQAMLAQARQSKNRVTELLQGIG